jgi:uncharacterized protein (TIGR02453 family)
MVSRAKKLAAVNEFKGFPVDALTFLSELALNNDRNWFTENKARYVSNIVEPSLDFIQTIAPQLGRISPHFQCIPKRIGGSLIRIYRDVRFSHDKRPYKTNIGIHFRHEAGKDIHAPGYYFHVGVDECFVGAGIWHPDAEALHNIRQRIIGKPDEWHKVKRGRRFSAAFELSGDALKRPPRGFDKDHPLMEDIKRKDFIAIHYFDHGLVHDADILGYAIETYRKASPLMAFLCRSQGVPF